MDISRRKFLKVGGASILALGALPLRNVLAGTPGSYKPDSKVKKPKTGLWL